VLNISINLHTFIAPKLHFMKSLQLRLLSLMLLISPLAKSQSDLEFTGAVGVASYYGDLVQSSPFFRQPSFAISLGANHYFSPHWAIRGDLSFLTVKGNDSKNKRDDLKARNLSFKSNIWDFSVAGQYDVIDLSSGEHSITPYVFLGVGFFHFNPTTVDRFGNKINLKLKGTEGQGTAAYPDRQPYKTTQLQLPFGFGVKYNVNESMSLGLEFKYRYIDTDYLDDVSMAGYPDMAVLAAKDPTLPGLAYRGDELPGGAPYPPKNGGLNRGNPDNNDAYYSFQAKFTWRFKNNRIQINY